VIIDPNRPATYDQARQMLTQPRCVGIKIHPEEHIYPIRRHGDALFAFAAEHRAVVLSHSSERNSIAADLAFFADRYPEMTLILAHIGCGFDGDPTHQVRAAAGCRHGNVYADTSSAQSIMPGLIELAVREMGADRILYGTDTPLYFAPMQRARIDHADLPDEQKRMILRDNAVRLLGLDERSLVSAADTVAMADPG
jgi:predicted TIM-barrel fold metal-dependent hydrolase